MRFFSIILLSGPDRDGQIVLFRRNGAIIACRIRTIRIIGFVEIQDQFPPLNILDIAFQVAAGAIAFLSAGDIAEWDEQVFLVIIGWQQRLRLIYE